MSPCFLALLSLLVFPEKSWATLITYPAPPGVVPYQDYRVQVNGQALSVYCSGPAAFAHFSADEPVQVAIHSVVKINWVDIRPKSLGIKSVLKDNVIYFQLAKPCKISIEINGNIALNGYTQLPLFLFADPLEARPPRPGDPNVRYFEAGKVHDAGEIHLKDDQTLYIAGGAVVRGVVRAENAKNIRITGRGILDGGFLTDRKTLVALTGCRNVQIEGIIIHNSIGWTVFPKDCEGVSIKNLKIVSWRQNSDGIDVVSSSRVLIDSCFIYNADDCIVLKSWKGNDKYGHSEPGPDVRDVQVLNSVFWNQKPGNALEIGYELRSREISDVLFKNCDVIHVEQGAVISIHNGDFATIRNIRFEDIRIEDARHKLFDIGIYMSRYSLDRPKDERQRASWGQKGTINGVLSIPEGEKPQYAQNRGHIRDIVFKNIAIVDGPMPFSIITGFDQAHRVEKVRIENLSFHGTTIRDAHAGRLFTELVEDVQFLP